MKPNRKITYTVLALTIMLCYANLSYGQLKPLVEGYIPSALNTMDITGKVWRQVGYSELSGSPYLSSEWGKGIVKLANNKVTNGIDLKYDQIADVLLYKNSKDEVMEIAEPVAEFKIAVKTKKGEEEHLFRTGFKPVGNNKESSFYEVLSDGNVKFLKKTIKFITEEKEYNSSTVVKKINDKIAYYIVKPDEAPILVSKTEKDILGAINDKKIELTNYISENKLNLKKEEDILKLLEYYFTITKKA
ncbi:hypothetical protein [Pedobacter sp. UC225_65]|uniref:hypothetical protein n=1 Tax=Pedobacter sp. UC225_65 TaxID=3350173 RepID=UPI00366C67B3